jgi:hypothetical protein
MALLICMTIILVVFLIIDIILCLILEYREYRVLSFWEGFFDFPVIHILIFPLMFLALLMVINLSGPNTKNTVSDSGSSQIVMVDENSNTKEYLYQIQKTQSKDVILKWKKLDSSINDAVTNNKNIDKNNILKMLADCPDNKNRFALETIIQCNPIDINYLQKTYHDYLFKCIIDKTY